MNNKTMIVDFSHTNTLLYSYFCLIMESQNIIQQIYILMKQNVVLVTKKKNTLQLNEKLNTVFCFSI